MGTFFSRSMANKVTKPVIFVNGSTGTGKSDLAVALAERFNGEVINADAMQLYKGLDIVTNKITTEEQKGVPHHLLSLLEPESLSFTIHDFKRSAMSIIGDLKSKDKVPIVVGGTNYYVDSLIWESLIPKHEATEKSLRFEPCNDEPSFETLSFMFDKAKDDYDVVQINLLGADSAEVARFVQGIDTNYLRLHIDQVNSPKLHSLLMIIDKETALTLHPNTVRKIIRAIEIFKHHGKPQSAFLSDINARADEQTFGARLNYTNSVVLWLQCKQDILDERLDSRVDKMLGQGLIEELDSFHQSYNREILSNPRESNHAKYTRGVFQCIGFKEFHDYLVLTTEERQSTKGEQLILEGVKNMKTATRRYARYQNKWVRKRFFEERQQNTLPPIYSFDSSDKDKFTENVVQPAINVIEELMLGAQPTRELFTMETKTKDTNPAVFKTCDVCGVICVRKAEWDMHIASKKHHKRLASHKKQQARLKKEHELLSQTLSQHETTLKNKLAQSTNQT